jgi:hypothetical protein
MLELGGFFPLQYFIFFVYGFISGYLIKTMAPLDLKGQVADGSPLSYPSSLHAPFRYKDIHRSGSTSGTDDFTEYPRCSSFGGYGATPS